MSKYRTISDFEKIPIDEFFGNKELQEELNELINSIYINTDYKFEFYNSLMSSYIGHCNDCKEKLDELDELFYIRTKKAEEVKKYQDKEMKEMIDHARKIAKKEDGLSRLKEAKDYWLKWKEIAESYKEERERFDKDNREFLHEMFGVSKPNVTEHIETVKEFYERWGCVVKDDKEPKEHKVPLHPGKIANGLLIEAGYGTFRRGIGEVPGFDKVVELDIVSEKLNITGTFLLNFLNGFESVDYNMAFKLSYIIRGTDIKFWVDLQEKYDEYVRSK